MVLLFRDRTAAFFTFVFPLLYAVFFGAIFAGSGPRNISVVVVDEDRGERSAALVSSLSKTEGLRVDEAPDASAGEAMVRRGERAACVIVKQGFGEGLSGVIFGGKGTMEVIVDPSRKAEAAMLAGLLTQAGYTQLIDQFSSVGAVRSFLGDARRRLTESKDLDAQSRADLGAMADLGDRLVDRVEIGIGDSPAGGTEGDGGLAFHPIEVIRREVARENAGPPSSFAVSFPQASVWGLTGAVMTFAMSLVLERSKGTLVRLLAGPIGPAQVLGGKALACFVTAVLVQAVMVGAARLFFGVQPGSWVTLAVGVGFGAFAFSGIMTGLAVLGRTERGAGGVGWAVMLVLTLIGGGAIPLAFMPEWLQSMSSISPCKWAILAVEGGVWRGYSAREMLLPCGVLAGIGLAGLGLGFGLFDRLQRG